VRSTARSRLARTDKVAATTLPAQEAFTTVRTAKSGEVLRGVSFTPGTGEQGHGVQGYGGQGR
jgi:hypothetical protein